eukprot:1195232-Prorocentrum_minimum.AAC.1
MRARGPLVPAARCWFRARRGWIHAQQGWYGGTVNLPVMRVLVGGGSSLFRGVSNRSPSPRDAFGILHAFLT